VPSSLIDDRTAVKFIDSNIEFVIYVALSPLRRAVEYYVVPAAIYGFTESLFTACPVGITVRLAMAIGCRMAQDGQKLF
jgi:hypothetical protein